MENYKTEFFPKTTTRDFLRNDFENRGMKFLALKQVHGNRVLVASDKDVEMWTISPPEADACLTKLDHLVLSVHTADCLPLLAYGGKWRGACHAGWRGLTNKIINEFFSEFQKQGVSVDKIKVLAGPSICKNHFEVHLDVANELASCVQGAASHVSLHPDSSKRFVDLKAIAKLQISSAGIKPNQIQFSDECTYCLPEKYFSFRRDKVKGCLNESIIYK